MPVIGAEHLYRVPVHAIPNVWPLVAGMIDDAYAAMDEITPDVRPWLLSGGGVLWVLMPEDKIMAAATTSLVKDRHGGLYCRVVACGGAKADWEGCASKIESYAKAEGCYKVSIDGRLGWGRVLSRYAPICVSFEKRI